MVDPSTTATDVALDVASARLNVVDGQSGSSSPIPRRNEGASPDSLAALPSPVLEFDVVGRKPAVGERPTLSNHHRVDVRTLEPGDVADGDDTAVLIAVPLTTSDPICADPR